MCASAGILGKMCTNGCREADPLADDNDGSPVFQDREETGTEKCIYKVMVMPDEETIVGAKWYQYVIEGTGDGEDEPHIDKRPKPKPHLMSKLVYLSIHHQTIMSSAVSGDRIFPRLNYIPDEDWTTDSDSRAQKKQKQAEEIVDDLLTIPQVKACLKVHTETENHKTKNT